MHSATQLACASPLELKSLEWQKLAIQFIKDLRYDDAVNAAREALSLCPRHAQLAELVHVLDEKIALKQHESESDTSSSTCDSICDEESSTVEDDDKSCSTVSTDLNSNESDTSGNILPNALKSCEDMDGNDREALIEGSLAQLRRMNHHSSHLVLASATEEQHRFRKATRETLQGQLTRLRITKKQHSSSADMIIGSNV
jgi:hypothetical protein